MTTALLVALLQVAVTGTPSRPDAEGAYTVTLDMEQDMPAVVQPGRDWERVYVFRLPGGVKVRKVRSFFGVDRGNIFEGHLIVQAEDFDLHRTSPHKETLASYDAYAWEATDYRVPGGGANLYVHTLCRATSRASVACHFGVILELGR